MRRKLRTDGTHHPVAASKTFAMSDADQFRGQSFAGDMR
jgi:hypothetical protein